MIVQGSLNYTTSGRSKVSSKSRKKRRQQIHHWQTTKDDSIIPGVDWKDSNRPVYPSVALGEPNPDETAKQDKSYASSSKYTIAPAYNKGAYQVIGKENIKDIGR
jgi:hypothetical protein